jgi:iron complex transport system substrate-binding protein
LPAVHFGVPLIDVGFVSQGQGSMRIVSLISSATEMLYALGLGDAVVAVSHGCDYPADASRRPRATFAHVNSAAPSSEIDAQVKSLFSAGQPLYGINIELLARLQPDLIVTQAQCDVCAIRYQDVLDVVEQTPALRGTQIVALNPRSLGDVLADVRTLGAATQRNREAAQLVAALEARVSAVRWKTAGIALEDRPRTACLEWIEPPMLAANWTPELLNWAGGRCELTEPERHSGYTTWEDIARFDAEVVVVMPCGFDLARSRVEAQSLTALREWSRLSAVRDNRVYVVDGNAYFNRSGPRLFDSLELLAHLLHPDRCGEVSSAPQGVVWQRGL